MAQARRCWTGLLCLAALLGAAAAAEAQRRPPDLGWSTYRNERFGLQLEYPAGIFRPERAAAQGEGQAFVSEDGQARLLVGAFANTDGHNAESYQRYIVRESYGGARFDYAPRGRSWLVVSGTRADRMFYEKVFFSCGGQIINSFAMIYPLAERRLYDPIVERIEDTFRPGECRD
jgi:hypothetical protein